MWQKIFIIPALFCAVATWAEVVLVRDGAAQGCIVLPDQPAAVEEFAAAELKHWLKQSSGVELPVRQESEALPPGTSAIYVGDTRLARQSGIEIANLAAEEWFVTSLDNQLLVTGGRPRGVIYAAHRLLEKELGCRFLAEACEVIPAHENIVFDAVKIHGQPSFRLRHINDDLEWGDAHEPSTMHKIRNGANAFVPEALGGFFAIGAPGPHHTFHAYSEAWDNPELFSLNPEGKRLRSRSSEGPGQWCLSNEELRRLALERLRGFIAADRARGLTPVVYDISQNDNLEKCVCASCLATAERYGAYSGLQIAFINTLARAIAAEYPEISLRTFAYNYGQEPPTGIAVEPNVLIHLAPMGYEFKEDRDTLRELSAPANARVRALIERWSQIAPQLAIWDYWILFATDYTAPYTNVWALEENLRFYRDCGVKDIYVESERPYSGSFTALRRYVGERLMLDADASAEPLVEEFLAGYYGEAAAPFMRRYLDTLTGRQKNFPVPVGTLPPERRGYLDADFFQTVFGELDGALAVTADLRQRQAIEREYIPVLAALFQRWGVLTQANDGIPLPQYDLESLLERLERYLAESLEHYFPVPEDRARFAKVVQNWVRDFRLMAAELPPPFELHATADQVRLFPPGKFRIAGAARLEPDPKSAIGYTVTLTGAPEKLYPHHQVNFAIVSFRDRQALTGVDVPLSFTDTYQLYRVGDVALTGADDSVYVGAPWSCEIQVPLAELPPGNYTVWLSAKLQNHQISVDQLWAVENKK